MVSLLSRTATRACAAGRCVLVAVLLSGCWSTPPETVQPRDGRAGLQLTGTVAGRQLAVNDGAPDLVVGDCDPDVGGDQDVCAIAAGIGGELVVLVFENPDVLRPATTLAVADPGCGQRCDDVTDVAVVDLQLGTGRRMRAHGGRLVLGEVIPFSRYAGDVRLSFAEGSAAGSFDLVPRSD